MAEHSRIDDLRRRVQKDPASIAFAQLAEECRRAGEYQEAADICRSGLGIHPAYLSARVTLGRALIELGQLEDAQGELVRVLESAPENLAAIRGLAEIYHRRGELSQALAQYRAALLLARNDPDLEQTIADLSRQVEPAKPEPSGGLTLEHMQHELLKHAPSPKASAAQVAPSPRKATDPAATAAQVAPSPQKSPSADIADPAALSVASPVPSATPPSPNPAADSAAELAGEPGTESSLSSAFDASSAVTVDPPPALPPVVGSVSGTLHQSPDDRATRTVAALEEWLATIHVVRARRRA